MCFSSAFKSCCALGHPLLNLVGVEGRKEFLHRFQGYDVVLLDINPRRLLVSFVDKIGSLVVSELGNDILQEEGNQGRKLRGRKG